MNSEKGLIFDISRTRLYDGPGIRTAVFLKGCPLRCVWCHNPESQRTQPELLYAEHLCVHCGKCAKVCSVGCHKFQERHELDRTYCIGCGECAEKCPTSALRLAGKPVTAEEVIKEVLKDKVYYEESGGGMTVTGGEPMLQIDFLEKLLYLARKEGIHTCIETCGYAPSEYFRRICAVTNCFLYDWKESDPIKHREYTGVDNLLIRQNLELLNEMGADIILRMPLIPGYNDSEEHLEETAKIVNRCTHIKRVEILPYHALGISKVRELGRNPENKIFKVPEARFLEEYVNRLQEKVLIEVFLSK